LIAEGTYHELRKKVPEKRKLIVEVNIENTEKLKEEISNEFGFKTYSESYKVDVFYNDDSILDEIIAVIRNKTKIRSIQTVEPSLEDTFIFFSAKNNEGGNSK